MATGPTTEAGKPATTATEWVAVGRPGVRSEDAGASAETTIGSRRIWVQLVAGIALALVAVTLGGAFAARRLAEREAVNDAASIADVLAETVVQPALTDALLDGDATARQRFDALVRSRVLGDTVVRVKIWSPSGEILYSDQAPLIGRRFTLEPAEQRVLRRPRTVAEISDLDHPENALDRQIGTKLVEVYRPVWTPTGREALFEIYTSYDQVTQRTGQLWRGFAGVTLSSLLLFVVLVAPLMWHLLSRVRRGQEQRERLLEQSVDASDAERRRIAANLHDGPVQDLAAASFVIAGATAKADAAGRDELASDLRGVAGSVRTSIRALRTLLVDLYPPSLARAGLSVALTDLAQTVRAPGLHIEIEPPPGDPGLTGEQERLVYRVAQECLRNAAKHAAPCTVHIALRRLDDEVVLEVADDGPGFVPASVLEAPAGEHFGLRLLADLVSTEGGRLDVASAPGEGTRWRLRVPLTPYAEEGDR